MNRFDTAVASLQDSCWSEAGQIEAVRDRVSECRPKKYD
jgi:hypothetical protein